VPLTLLLLHGLPLTLPPLPPLAVAIADAGHGLITKPLALAGSTTLHRVPLLIGLPPFRAMASPVVVETCSFRPHVARSARSAAQPDLESALLFLVVPLLLNLDVLRGAAED
jgi:hypothetical protein